MPERLDREITNIGASHLRARISITLLFLSLAIWGPPATAQATGTSNSGVAAVSNTAHDYQGSEAIDPGSARSRLASSLSDMGGSALGGIKDAEAQVTITPSSPDATPSNITIKTLGTDKMRMEEADGRPLVVENAGVVWISGESKYLSTHTTGPVWPHLPIVSIASDLTNGQISTVADDASLPDAAGSHIKMRITRSIIGDDPDIRPKYEVEITPSTGLIERITFQRGAPSNLRQAVGVELALSDYRAVGPLLVPFHIFESIHGQAVRTIQINTLKFNQGLSGEMFQLPQEGGR